MKLEDIDMFKNLFEDFRDVRSKYIDYVQASDHENIKRLRDEYADDAWAIKQFDEIDAQN